ncbi:MAG: class I SAM-dependent methyltransferase, partial [Pseudomonadota bacterium]
VSLDKYTILDATGCREVYNWLQYFSPESLQQEVTAAGLQIAELYGDVAGGAYDPESPEFAVVLEHAS